MARRRPARFINTYFSRYIEEQLDNIPPDYLRNLDSHDRAILLRSRSKFMATGTLEEKLLLLAKVGVRFAITTIDTKKKHPVSKLWRLFKIFFNTVGFNKRSAVKELKDAGVFVMSDVDFVRSFAVASHIYNSQLYNMTTSYADAADKLYQWHKDGKKLQKEITSMQEFDKMILKVIAVASSTSANELFLKQFGIDYKGYQVLAVVSKLRMAKMADIEKGTEIFALARVVKNLLNLGLVDNTKSSVTAVNEYMITGKGEDVLITSRNYFIQQIFK